MKYFLRSAFGKAQGATMIELLAVLAIMGMGIAALLETIGGGIYFSKDTENNIKAINIAREGIEGITNIRDTNWMRFSSDRQNCWRTNNYDGTCINNPSFAGLLTSGTYIMFPKNGAWYLSGVTAPSYSTNWAGYSSVFKVGLDSIGFWTQTGVITSQTCSSQTQTGCLTPFTREIDITLVGTGTMKIKSVVRWQGKRSRAVTIESVLTNWKSNF